MLQLAEYSHLHTAAAAAIAIVLNNRAAPCSAAKTTASSTQPHTRPTPPPVPVLSHGSLGSWEPISPDTGSRASPGDSVRQRRCVTSRQLRAAVSCAQLLSALSACASLQSGVQLLITSLTEVSESSRPSRVTLTPLPQSPAAAAAAAGRSGLPAVRLSPSSASSSSTASPCRQASSPPSPSAFPSKRRRIRSSRLEDLSAWSAASRAKARSSLSRFQGSLVEETQDREEEVLDDEQEDDLPPLLGLPEAADLLPPLLLPAASCCPSSPCASAAMTRAASSSSLGSVDSPVRVYEEEQSSISYSPEPLPPTLFSSSSSSSSPASSSSSSPVPPSYGQRLVWIGMSSAARNPLAQQRHLAEAEAEQRAGRAAGSGKDERQPRIGRRAVHSNAHQAELLPSRSSARVMALQEEKAQSRRRRDRQARAQQQTAEGEEDDDENRPLRLRSSRARQQQQQQPSKQLQKKAAGRPSPSSSSSWIPPAAPPHAFLATLASFSRIGFEAWRPVAWQHIPHMTYEGYVALAYDSLESSTRAAIRASQPYVPEHGEQYHSDPWPLIYGQTPPPLSLYRRVDRVYGREEYRVCANRRLQEKEVVAFLAGRLTEQAKAQKERALDEQHHFFMERSYLQQFFGYEGEHSLMISTAEHRSIASYIRDPCEKTDGEDANVKVDITLDTVTGLFFVVLFADEPIAKGEELYCLPFLGRFLSRAHRQMFLYARISHWFHRWATLLERALLSQPALTWERAVPASITPQPLTAEQEAKHYGDEDARSEVYQVTLEEGYTRWSLVNALLVAKCRYASIAFLGDGVTEEVRDRLRAVPDFLPEFVTLKTDGRKLRVDRESLLTIVQEGHDREMIEVREDRCIGSPVRYFDVPSRPSFCVMARRSITPGTFVFTYAGEISTDVRNHASTYVYNLPCDEIRRCVPHYTDLPNLYLDALYYGNIARFVNDNRYRLGEEGGAGSTANIECQFLFHSGIVHLAFYATRSIAAGEELVSQYGDDYWKTINSRLIDDHKQYYDYASTYCQHLARTLQQHGLPLPARPDYRVESYRLFEHKPEPYPSPLPHLPTASSLSASALGKAAEEPVNPRYEVQQILDHYPAHCSSASRGVTHYLVQWVGYDASTWETAENMDGCEKLIDTYFELRGLERKATRPGAAKKGPNGHRRKKRGRA